VVAAAYAGGPLESGLGRPPATTGDRGLGRATGVRRRGPRQPAVPGGRCVVPRRHRAPPAVAPGLLPAVAVGRRAAERGARRGGRRARMLTNHAPPAARSRASSSACVPCP